MGIESLDQLEIVHGTFTLIFVIVSLIVGIRILIKYRISKKIEHITLGLAWIFLSSAWWGSSFSFFSILIINVPLNSFSFLFIGNVFIPIAIITWLYSITHIFKPELEKKVLLVALIAFGTYEFFLIFFLFTNPSIVGTIESKFYSKPNLFSALFQLCALSITIITGTIFSIKSMKSEDPKIQWRGRFLLLAFLTLTIGSFLDILTATNAFMLVFIRLLLMASAVEYYFSFFLPDKLANLLIKEK